MTWRRTAALGDEALWIPTWSEFFESVRERLLEVYEGALIASVEPEVGSPLDCLVPGEALRAVRSGVQMAGWPERLSRLRVQLVVRRRGEAALSRDFHLDPNRTDQGRGQLLRRLPQELAGFSTPWVGRIRVEFISVPDQEGRGFQRWWVEVGSDDDSLDPDVRATLKELRAQVRNARRLNEKMFECLLQSNKYAPLLLGAHAEAIESWAGLVGQLEVPLAVPSKQPELPEVVKRVLDEVMRGHQRGPMTGSPGPPPARPPQSAEELEAALDELMGDLER